MTETNATNEYCCTCQSWQGERRYDPRHGKVKYENRAPTMPCNMNYRKPGACSKGNCKGYVRWVELGQVVVAKKMLMVYSRHRFRAMQWVLHWLLDGGVYLQRNYPEEWRITRRENGNE